MIGRTGGMQCGRSLTSTPSVSTPAAAEPRPTLDQLEHLIVAAIRNDDWATATHYGALLDSAEQRTPPPTLHSSALWYASEGHPVFPLQPGTKIPFPGSRGCKEATTDPATINQWWAHHPDANIGLATGHTLDVWDIDGPTGVRSRLDHWDAFTQLTTLGVVSTPRPGGTHIYVPASGEGNKAGLLPGVDYRGRGGYVVAPPSVIVGGPGVKHPGGYTWRQPLLAVVS